jgi:type IV fimbrial biogenesis protein FimT
MQHARGFTLVELMVTIGVAAILIGLAVPGFVTTIRDSQMTSASNDLLVSIQLARSEAIKRHLPVSVCRSANATDDAPSCGGGDGWQDGWIVFADGTEAAPDPNGTLDDGEQLLHQSRGFRGSVTAQAAANAAPLEDFVTFLGSGFPQGEVPGGRNLLLCDDRHSDGAGRVLNISQTGRPQVRRVGEVVNLNMSCQE